MSKSPWVPPPKKNALVPPAHKTREGSGKRGGRRGPFLNTAEAETKRNLGRGEKKMRGKVGKLLLASFGRNRRKGEIPTRE